MSWPTKSNDDVVQPDSVRPALPEEIEQVLDAVPEDYHHCPQRSAWRCRWIRAGCKVEG